MKRLSLTHFRSYTQLELDCSERVLVILGPNATGKTNILEALFVAATGRSFRAEDETLVQYNQPGYRLDVVHEEETISVTYQTRPKRKKFLRNEVAIPRHTLLGLHPVVLFDPSDSALFSASPERRRRYIDLVLTQTDHLYHRAYVEYRRILRQRNSLLWHNRRDSLPDLEDQLFILDTQLSEPAETLYKSRQTFLSHLEPIVKEKAEHISQKKLDLRIEYMERTSDLGQRLLENRQRDIVVGTTSAGPHREDWHVLHENQQLSYSASRGETRTAILALKLAEIEYIQSKTEQTPLLLLDDVFSELDESRRHWLVDGLTDVQTIITTTDFDRRLDLPAQILDLTRPLE